MSQDRAGASGRTQRLVIALMCLMVPGLVALVPMPGSMLEWLSPGAVAARGGEGLGVLSLAPDHTVGAVFEWWLACGFVAVLGLWCAGADARHLAERAAVWGLGAYVLVAGGHTLVGAESIFGVLEVQGQPERLLLPLVNPNHAATPVLLVLPVVIGRAVEQIGKGSPRGWVAALVAVGAVGFLVLAGSVGGWLALAVMGFVAWTRAPSRLSRPAKIAAGLSSTLLVLGVGLQLGVISEAWLNASWWPRFGEAGHYGVTIAGHWFAGVGPGAFFEAAGLNSGHMKGLTLTDHAHIGWAEWLLETGLVGLLVLGGALALFPRWQPSRRPERAWRWTLGLVGVGTHCLVDFPLQIKAVFLLAVAVLTVRMVAYCPLEKGSARAMRKMLVGLAVAQLFGAAWQAHAHLVEREAGFALNYEEDAHRARQAENRLAGFAPWRMEARLVRMWNAEVAGDRNEALNAAADVVARHLDDPDALRHAGYGFLRLGDEVQAEGAFRRSVERRPSEYRAWLMLSGIAEGQGKSLDAAKAMLRAIRHWPTEMWPGWWTEADPLIQGYEMLPVGIWWVDGLSDANGWWSALLGGLLLDKGEAEAALMAFEQADELGPFWVRNRAGPAQALVALGRIDEAESYLLEKIDNGATHAELRKELALVYARQGKEDEALKAMQEGILLADKKDDFAGLGVRDLAEVSSDELGIRLGERLVLVGHAGPVFSTNLAVLYYRVGRKVDCRRMLDQAEVMMQKGLQETWDFLSPRCGPGP
ncbi:MAG: tetratricopeptide repeat protein [Myxococcota bacterium]|nr:tetratricopeptide repeat protein [Myxococcota bacterium]